jgi:hypothetical protein
MRSSRSGELHPRADAAITSYERSRADDECLTQSRKKTRGCRNPSQIAAAELAMMRAPSIQYATNQSSHQDSESQTSFCGMFCAFERMAANATAIT